jgi:hypothetical protein
LSFAIEDQSWPEALGADMVARRWSFDDGMEGFRALVMKIEGGSRIAL